MSRTKIVSLLVSSLILCSAFMAYSAAETAPTQEQLLALLRSDAGYAEQWDAARLLARTATPEAVPALAAMLAGEKTSELARCALQGMPGPAAVDALRGALGTLQGKLRIGVIASLGVRRDAKSVEPLAGLLADPDPATVTAVAAALGSIATPQAAEALLKNESSAPAAARAAVDSALLRCADAAIAEGRLEPAQAICDRLRDPQKPDGIRMAAIRGAILARGEAAPKMVLELAAGDDPIARSTALRVATHELSGAAATQALAAGLGTLPADRKLALVQVLGNRGDAAAIPALLTAAGQAGHPGRLAAIAALARFARPEAVPVLAAAAAEDAADVAGAAQQALSSFPGREAEAAIASMLENGKPAERLAGIRMAQERRMASALPVLMKTAVSGDPPARLAALKALGELAGESDLPGLLGLLAGAATPQDRAAAEQAVAAVIGGANPDAAVGQCIARLADAPAPFKCSLLRVLGLAGGAKALAAVQGALEDPGEEIRSAAMRSLIEWKNVEAAPVLMRLATSAPVERDRLLCLRACIGFANQPGVPVAQRLAMCRQVAPLIQRNDEKILLLGALGGIAHPQSLAMIAPHLDEPALSGEAAAAVLSVAEQMLKGRNAAAQAAALAGPLQKVAQVTAGKPEAARAEALLKKAQSPAPAPAAKAKSKAKRAKKK